MKLTKMHKRAIVRAIMQDTPPIDKAARAEAIKAAVIKAMSPGIRRLYKTSPEALRTRWVDYTNPLNGYGTDLVVGDVTKEQLDKITEPYMARENNRWEMEKRLNAAFEGINTLKQAETTFPEFKKYYPTEAQPTKNLPAIANVVADLSRLGWPKGETK